MGLVRRFLKFFLFLSFVIGISFGLSINSFVKFQKSIEKKLDFKIEKSQFSSDYKLVKILLNKAYKDYKVGNVKEAIKKYILWKNVFKLLNTLEKGENIAIVDIISWTNLELDQAKIILYRAFDNWKYLRIALKVPYSIDDLRKRLYLAFWNYKLLFLGSNTYIIKVPKDNIFSKIFLQKIKSGILPKFKLLDCEVIYPSIIRIDSSDSIKGEEIDKLRWMRRIEADKIQDKLIRNKDIIVAVIDTWIDRYHKDLKNNIRRNKKEIPDNWIDDDNNGYVDDIYGRNTAENNNNTLPWHWHWTHVAWTIAAEVNWEGVFWVNSIAKLMAVKVFYWNNTYTDSYSISEGIKYAVDNGAKVINMSLWGWYDELEEKAIKYAYNKGVIVVAAAGNENKNASSTYPCAFKETICVGAIDQKDKKASFSNYWPVVDIAAPWVYIYSTKTNDSYLYANGTSMATPHVAWVVSIIKLYKSNVGYSEVKDILRKNWDKWPDEIWWVIVNARKVFEKVSSQRWNFPFKEFDFSSFWFKDYFNLFNSF